MWTASCGGPRTSSAVRARSCTCRLAAGAPALQAALQRAAARQVKVTTMAFGSAEPVGDEFVTVSEPRRSSRAVRLLVVVADRAEVVIGGAVG